jgi:hypothetical protein
MNRRHFLITVTQIVAVPALLKAQAQIPPTTGQGGPAGPGNRGPKLSGPPFKAQNLTLTDIPKATGPSQSLFNGRNLNDWEPWLGPKGPMNPDNPGKPLGATGMGDVFKMVTEEGAPAIFINGSGQPNGCITHKQIIGNYHLQLYHKWGAKKGSVALNSGLLYHSFGEPGGGFNNTWMKSIEYEIMEGSVGMLLAIGSEIRFKMEMGLDNGSGRYMPGGTLTTITGMGMFKAEKDTEKPAGQWNKVELYAFEDRALHVVNGVPVMMVQDLQLVGEDGKTTPYTKGRIQLQTEGADLYYRDITIEPINAMPKIVVA